MRHGEVENQVAGASGVLQVVEDLNTAFLPILGAQAGRDSVLRPPRPSAREPGPASARAAAVTV